MREEEEGGKEGRRGGSGARKEEEAFVLVLFMVCLTGSYRCTDFDSFRLCRVLDLLGDGFGKSIY